MGCEWVLRKERDENGFSVTPHAVDRTNKVPLLEKEKKTCLLLQTAERKGSRQTDFGWRRASISISFLLLSGLAIYLGHPVSGGGCQGLPFSTRRGEEEEEGTF